MVPSSFPVGMEMEWNGHDLFLAGLCPSFNRLWERVLSSHGGDALSGYISFLPFHFNRFLVGRGSSTCGFLILSARSQFPSHGRRLGNTAPRWVRLRPNHRSLTLPLSCLSAGGCGSGRCHSGSRFQLRRSCSWRRFGSHPWRGEIFGFDSAIPSPPPSV